jgi:hypothetical protein
VILTTRRCGETARTTHVPPSRRASCLISCSQPGPEGGTRAAVGRQGTTKPEGVGRIRGSTDMPRHCRPGCNGIEASLVTPREGVRMVSHPDPRSNPARKTPHSRPRDSVPRSRLLAVHPCSNDREAGAACAARAYVGHQAARSGECISEALTGSGESFRGGASPR